MQRSDRYLRVTGIILLTAVTIVCVAGCRNSSGSAASGKESDNHSRIVSLTPSITQSIYQLKATDNLVGCSSYCQTADSDSIVVAGSVIGPDIERIVSLRPDLVIVSDLVSDNDVETLERFGLRIELFPSPHSYEEICSQFVRVGRLTGKEKEAVMIVEASKAEVNELSRKRAQRSRKPGIFIQIGASPIFTVIPGTYMDDYISFSGGTNIAGELTSGVVGREFVVAQDPDFIFIVTMGIAGEAEKEQWRLFNRMKAAAGNNIHIIDSEIACQPTPETFTQTLRLINYYLEGWSSK
jgi:ABC-type Fe3+-hydroxamate transport system substrate-binding protein